MAMMRKTAIFGGAFNPVHIGHVELCRAFCRLIGFDRVLLMPTRLSPHKSSDQLIDARYRRQMCEIAARSLENAEVSSLELERQGKSYTVDTLRQLKRLYPDDRLYLICGSDMFLTLHDWREPVEIFKLAVICAAKRGDACDDAIQRQNEMLKALGAETVLTDCRIPPVSSTQIRTMVKNGENCKDLLPDGVWEYIMAHRLYQ